MKSITDFNLILLIGGHGAAVMIATEHIEKAFWISGSSAVCFLIFASAIWLTKKIHPPPEAIKTEVKKKRIRHAGARKNRRK